MMLKQSLLALVIATVVMTGCKKKEETAAAPAPAAPAATDAAPAPAAAPSASEAPSPTASAATFNLASFPVSDKPLGEWPYLQLPAGYRFVEANDMAAASKDLARVPVWTGADMVWVEGKTFESALSTQEGKTFSKFELEKGLGNAIEALGGKRVTDKSVDEAYAEAHQAELESFLKEFDEIDDAYRYYNKANTWLVRRADKAIWFVTHVDENHNASVMVVEGPLPVAGK